MPRAQLPPELALEVGKRYTIRPPRGRAEVPVGRVEGDEVLADFNNPAAGQGPDLGQGRRGPARDGRGDPTGTLR
jgi:hypothetical protein